jgi:hypothetical protein
LTPDLVLGKGLPVGRPEDLKHVIQRRGLIIPLSCIPNLKGLVRQKGCSGID